MAKSFQSSSKSPLNFVHLLVLVHLVTQTTARIVVVYVRWHALDEGFSSPVVLVQGFKPVLGEYFDHISVLLGSLAYNVDVPALSLLQVDLLVVVQFGQL